MKLSDKKGAARKKMDMKKVFVRAMALFLAFLMVIGAVTLIIQMFRFSAMAYETDDYKVRVGLMYGSGVTVGFETQAPYGFTIGSVTSDNEYVQLWQVTDTRVSVTCDSNLSKNNMTYSITSSQSPVIGGYHIECDVDTSYALAISAQYNQMLSGSGYYCFPAYVKGAMKLRFGHFGSHESAQNALSTVSSFLGSTPSLSIASPSETAVSVINPNTDTILFEYDSDSQSYLGMQAYQGGAEIAYIMTPAQNTYGGTFEYRRYKSGSTDGVELINVVDIEEYTEGVLPWEIGNSWPLEVQKAFAITVRTYAISKKDRHSNYGFDVCNGVCCQCYKGRNRVNETVLNAVSATKGMVLSYNGELAETYYSSSTGGTTVSINEAWGTTLEYPYLKAVATPWEKFSNYLNGSWTVSMTSDQLLSRLRNKGYTNLSGGIASVVIDKFAENSTYVYSITVTDIYGATATIRRSDTIRSVFGLNSANFVVAKAGEAVTVVDYKLASDALGDGSVIVDETGSSLETEQTPVTFSAIYDATVIDEGVHAMRGNGEIILDFEESVSTVKSIGGETLVNLTDVAVITSEGVTSFNMVTEMEEYYDMVEEFYSSYNPSVSETPTQGVSALKEFSNIVKTYNTVIAEGSAGSFVFIGRGWGHGVGMSQWGAKDLSDLGYSYEAILQAYFPGTVITDMFSGTVISSGISGSQNITEETTSQTEQLTPEETDNNFDNSVDSDDGISIPLG